MQSITRAVAYNIFGPAFPQALRVVRYPYHDYTSPSDDPVAMAEACPEDHTPSFITVEEQEKLQENSKVVAALEDVYSVMCVPLLLFYDRFDDATETKIANLRPAS
jgi:hypothetical protein